jgi:hypothetical protein
MVIMLMMWVCLLTHVLRPETGGEVVRLPRTLVPGVMCACRPEVPYQPQRLQQHHYIVAGLRYRINHSDCSNIITLLQPWGPLQHPAKRVIAQRRAG